MFSQHDESALQRITRLIDAVNIMPDSKPLSHFCSNLPEEQASFFQRLYACFWLGITPAQAVNYRTINALELNNLELKGAYKVIENWQIQHQTAINSFQKKLVELKNKIVFLLAEEEKKLQKLRDGCKSATDERIKAWEELNKHEFNPGGTRKNPAIHAKQKQVLENFTSCQRREIDAQQELKKYNSREKIEVIQNNIAQQTAALEHLTTSYAVEQQLLSAAYSYMLPRQQSIIDAFKIIYEAICAGSKKSAAPLLENIHNMQPITQKKLFILIENQFDKGLALDAFDLAKQHHAKGLSTGNIELVDAIHRKAFKYSGGYFGLFKRTKVISNKGVMFNANTREKYTITKPDIDDRLKQKGYTTTRLGRIHCILSKETSSFSVAQMSIGSNGMKKSG